MKALKSTTTAIALAVLVGLFVKVWLALNTIGTNDVFNWHDFLGYVITQDPTSIYRDMPLFNHPPLLLVYLWLIRHSIGDVESFVFFIRLPAILADCITPFLIFALVKKVSTEATALKTAALIALSPVLIMVSGFHGNTDPVFLLFMCCSLYFLIEKKSLLLSALFYGLSVNIKIVPLIFLPIIFFSLRGVKSRLQWSAVFAAIFLLGFGYHLAADFSAVMRNVFGYGSLQNIWGLTKFTMLAGFKNEYQPTLLKLIILIGISFKSYQVLNRFEMHSAQWQSALLRGMGIAIVFFFVLTPGFGVQYLAWIAILGVFNSFRFSFVSQTLSGSFLFLVYHAWTRGFPWTYANSGWVQAKTSWYPVSPWMGTAWYLDIVLWTFYAFWLFRLWVPYQKEFLGYEQTS